jgi:hypothetical protein
LRGLFLIFLWRKKLPENVLKETAQTDQTAEGGESSTGLVSFRQLTATPATLPTADEAAAFVLGRVTAVGDLTSEAQLAGLQARLEALRDPTSPAALAELKRQLPVLEAVFHRLTVEALRAGRPDTQVLILRTALQAQQAYTRTFALLLAMAPRKAGTVVEVPGDDEPNCLQA